MQRSLTLLCAALLGFALGSPLAQAQGTSSPDIRVLTLNTQRTSVCGGLDFNVASGNFFSGIRDELESFTNFGPGGTVDRAVQFLPSVVEFNEDTLSNADVVLISSLQARLTHCEILDLQEFVRQGGGLFAFSNNSILDFDEAFGAVGDTNPGTGNVTVTTPGSAVIQGPFGTVSNSLGGFPFHRTFLQLGPNTTAVLSSSAPLMGEVDFGQGKAILAGDEEWCGTGTVSGCASGQLPNADRETLFLNAFAAIVPPTSFQYNGPRQCIGSLDCDPASVNSRGFSGILYATGSLLAADNALTLHADRMPANELGFFLNGTASGLYNPPQSDGTICLIGAAIGRYNGAGQVLSSGPDGRFELTLDLNNTPTPFTPTVILAGETWRFQAWYRDGNSNNFTNAIELSFQ